MDLSSDALDGTRSRLYTRFGERVLPWWRQLPDTLGELATRWDLVLEAAVGSGNTSLVVRCSRGGVQRAILKLTPDTGIAEAEAFALRSWHVSGRVPRVWEYDAASGALLLEAIPAGSPAAETADAVPLREIAGLITALHSTGSPIVGSGVVPLAQRVERIVDRGFEQHRSDAASTHAVPTGRLERGAKLARALAADSEPPALLHGDLHPGNVLPGDAARGAVAIDPRPCVGDRAFDAIDWVLWPPTPQDWPARCRELSSALQVDPHRLWQWCAAFAGILAANAAARGEPRGKVDALLSIAP
ncbi:streptomycin 6-kinase [Haloechinothrix alba]|uniref:Streptomycin 6-kinase n=1 Tax=Haloechinothrix alba TaxID=664784 RepID=A0A238V3E5_9PSEU|nr:aminoglycoside phosphotransferase family protein [Haloechinothrix alba]SNR28691.1 streptomycin 6-kinase [Haloechinothrix alba]